MEYKRLGSSELLVSEICLGTMTYGQQNTIAEAHEQLDFAIAEEINFIDTAEMYLVPPKAETQGRTKKLMLKQPLPNMLGSLKNIIYHRRN
jgi:aryl-alcohol dehydrogenase-like predicted oxidoreductase